MSQSITEAAAAASADETAQAAIDTQAATDAAAATAATEAAAAEAAKTVLDPADPDAAAQAEADAAAALAAKEPKPKRTDRHIAHLTARAAAEADRANAAERRADAAEALVRAGARDGDKPPPAVTTGPATDVETRAAQLVEQRAFHARLGEIDAAGKKSLGADAWETAKATLTSLGATNNQSFLQALAETDNPAAIFAAMADDPDELMELLRKSPAAMGAKLERMDAALRKPAVKPLSAAPKPAARVDPGAVLPVTNIYDPAISNADLDKELDRLLPLHLGGKRKAA